MKTILALCLFFLFPGILAAQITKETLYKGFYHLNIPGFNWKDGAQLLAHFSTKSGTLNLDDTRNPLFITDKGDKIPLLLAQANRLVMLVSSGDRFNIWGIEAVAEEKEGGKNSFFVTLGATIKEHEIDLTPVESEARPAQRPQGGPPGAGSGGTGGGGRGGF